MMRLKRPNKKTVKIMMALSLLLIIIGLVVAYFVIASHKSNFEVTDTVKFKDFTIRVDSVKTSDIKLGALDKFYQPVWGRTEANISDCSSKSAVKVDTFLDSPRDDCERINGDIRRDLASKAGIAQYLSDNGRLDVTYSIVSKSNVMQVGDIRTSLVSGSENLSKKTLKYAFVYANESEVRTANDIEGGSLTKGLERSGLAWADIKKNTSVVNVKVSYKGLVKTISISKPFKY